MVCICRCSGRGRVRPGGTTGAARGLEGAAAAEVALALNGCRRAPESKRMPPDALPRPAILSKGTAKLTFWPTLSEPPTIPSILASLSTNTPPLDPGDNGAVNCKILYPLPAPGTSSAIRGATTAQRGAPPLGRHLCRPEWIQLKAKLAPRPDPRTVPVQWSVRSP